MKVNDTIKPFSRKEWRLWLEQHHTSHTEIWLLFDDRPDVQALSYLDTVEEALCFGWIDSIQKRFSPYERAQRFSPRRKNGNWTELNKARVRRLIQVGLMTDAGKASLPDLDKKFEVSQDILNALKAEPGVWKNYLSFPELYQRVRISYIEEMRRNPKAFEKRLSNFIKQTAANKMFGNWNDGGRLISTNLK